MQGFWGCKWCGGRGCISCDIQAEKAYAAAFPDGPPAPIVTFKTDDPADIALMVKTIGADAIKKAYSEGGGGTSELVANCEKAAAEQKARES